MKTNDLLLLGALGVGGYFLIKNSGFFKGTESAVQGIGESVGDIAGDVSRVTGSAAGAAGGFFDLFGNLFGGLSNVTKAAFTPKFKPYNDPTVKSGSGSANNKTFFERGSAPNTSTSTNGLLLGDRSATVSLNNQGGVFGMGKNLGQRIRERLLIQNAPQDQVNIKPDLDLLLRTQRARQVSNARNPSEPKKADPIKKKFGRGFDLRGLSGF